MSTLERAIQIAALAHADKFDKAGAPYILHPLRVMLACTTPEARIVGVLHDVVEDSEPPNQFTLDDLRAEGFSEAVVNAVAGVTKLPEEEGKDDEKYFAFIRRAMRDPIAREVKRADLIDNVDESRIAQLTGDDEKRMLKYRRALQILNGTGESH